VCGPYDDWRVLTFRFHAIFEVTYTLLKAPNKYKDLLYFSEIAYD
jgi:hypothetical protein